MLPSMLAGGLSLLLAAADQVGAGVSAPAPMPPRAAQAPNTRIPPTAFPSEEMAEQSAAYLAWTKAQGLSAQTTTADQRHPGGPPQGNLRSDGPGTFGFVKSIRSLSVQASDPSDE